MVKQAFDLVPRGVGAPRSTLPVLGLDRADERGRIIFPTDFALAKPLCDVGIVGPALGTWAGPARLAVEPMRRLAESIAELGPRRGVGPLGDPTGAVGVDWTSPSSDFEAFQWAPREQRILPPRLPLEVMVDAEGHRWFTRVEGTTPEALLIEGTGWTPPRAVALSLDSIAVDVVASSVELTWRGLVEVPSEVEPVLIVDTVGGLLSWPIGALLRWSRSDAVDPALLRRLAASPARSDASRAAIHDFEDGGTTSKLDLATFGDDRRAPTTARIVVAPPATSPAWLSAASPAPLTEEIEPPTLGPAAVAPAGRRLPGGESITAPFVLSAELREAATLPFRVDGVAPSIAHDRRHDAALSTWEEDPLVGTVVMQVGASVGAALPFQRAPSPVDGAATRASRIAVSEADDDPLVGTVAAVASPAAALPFRAIPYESTSEVPPPAPTPPPAAAHDPPSPPPLGTRHETAPPPPPTSASPSAPAQRVAHAHVPPPTAATDAGASPHEPPPRISAAMFASIKARLWDNGRSRRTTLAEHGISDLEWRVAEKRFLSGIVRATPEEQRAFLAALRGGDSRVPPGASAGSS